MKTMNKTLIASALCSAIGLVASPAFAAGFQLNSQSATTLGRAAAGDAIIADNASVMARNPAAMALFDEKAFSVGLAYVAPEVRVSDVEYNGTDLGGIDNAGSGSPVPNIYYIQPINDKWAFGFAGFTNFGTGTDTTELLGENLVSPDLLGKTEVKSVTLNGSISYRINDQLSVGAGLDVVYGMGTLTRNGYLNAPIIGPIPVEAVNADASGIGIGGIVGLAYEINDNHRLGVSYRFSPDIDASGDIFYLGAEQDELHVPLADIFQLAGYHKLTQKFALHYTAQWTNWSNFDSVDYTGLDGSHNELKEYAWKDSWFLSLGGTYDINEKWTVRAGYGYDQGVIDEIESVSIPDSDRQWVSLGATYHLSHNSSLDVGYTKVIGEEVDVVEYSALGGILNATTEAGANYFGVQYSRSF